MANPSALQQLPNQEPPYERRPNKPRREYAPPLPNLANGEPGKYFQPQVSPSREDKAYESGGRSSPRKRSATMASESDLTTEKIAASEARSDTKVARLEGKIDTLSAALLGKLDLISADLAKSRADGLEQRVEMRENKRAVQTTVIGSAFAVGALFVAIAGLLFGVAVYGDAIFGRGMNVRDVVQTVTQEILKDQQKRAPATVPGTNQ